MYILQVTVYYISLHFDKINPLEFLVAEKKSQMLHSVFLSEYTIE